MIINLLKFLKVLSVQFIIDLRNKCSFHLIQFVPLNTLKPKVSLYFMCAFCSKSLVNIT
uniref:Uncharacterized protein n=1 Tax=Rhizophora mucronata TaxID=61149 RepID=A0A2P2MJL0_RHIMU